MKVNKPLRLSLRFIAVAATFAVGLITIPIGILVTSGVADVYCGISPLYSIPVVGLTVVVILVSASLKRQTVTVCVDAEKWLVRLFNILKSTVQIPPRIRAPKYGSLRPKPNFIHSPRRVAVLRRGVLTEMRTESAAFDDAKVCGTVTGSSDGRMAATAR